MDFTFQQPKSDSPRFLQVLFQLGLTVNDIQPVTKVDVPPEFRDEADFYQQQLLEHLEQRRSKLYQEAITKYNNYLDSPVKVIETPEVVDRYIVKLHKLHQKEMQRITSQRQLIEEAEQQQQRKEEKIRQLNQNRIDILVKRQQQNAAQDQQRIKKLQVLSEQRQTDRQSLLERMQMDSMKWEQRRREQEAEKESRILQKDQEMSQRVQQVVRNKERLEQLKVDMHNKKRQSYDDKVHRIDVLKAAFKKEIVRNDYLRSRTKSTNQEQSLVDLSQQVVKNRWDQTHFRYQQQQATQQELNQRKLQAFEDSQIKASLIRSANQQEHKRKNILRHIKIEEAMFNQKRLEKINDLKKNNIIDRINKQDERMEVIKEKQQIMMKQRRKLLRQLERQKAQLLMNYSIQSTNRQQQLPQIQQIYQTPKKHIPSLVFPKRKNKFLRLPKFIVRKQQLATYQKIEELFTNDILKLVASTQVQELGDKLQKLYAAQDTARLKTYKQQNYLYLYQ